MTERENVRSMRKEGQRRRRRERNRKRITSVKKTEAGAGGEEEERDKRTTDGKEADSVFGMSPTTLLKVILKLKKTQKRQRE